MSGSDLDKPLVAASTYSRGLWSWGVMLICLIVTLATYLVVSDHEAQSEAVRFDSVVRETRLALQERLTYYTAALRGAQGLFSTTNDVTPAKWNSYVSSLDLNNHYPGIKGLSYVELVNGPTEHAELLARMAANGNGDFTLTPAGERDQYRVTTMMEPGEPNIGAIGTDRSVDRPFRLAMDRAAETAMPAMTPKVDLPYLRPSAAVVMYLPVYRQDMPITTAEERRAATLGWVSSSIRVSELMQGLSSRKLVNIAVAIYDDHADLNHLLYIADTERQKGHLSALLELPVAGRVWWLGFDSSPSFENSFWNSPSTLVLPVGTAIGCLLTVVVWSLTTTRNRAEEIALGMTAQLNKSEHQLRLFIEHAPAAVAMFDKDLRYIMTSRRWMTDYHLQNRQIIGKSHYEVFPDVPDHWREVHQRCLKGAVERNDGEKFVRADGQVQWLRWEVRPWLSGTWPDSEIGGLVMLTHDITPEKAAQEEASRASALARWVFSATSEVAIIGTDNDGLVTVFNVGAEKMLGYDAAEAVGKMTPVTFHDPGEVKQRSEEITLALNTLVECFDVFVEYARRGGAEEREWTYIRKDGSRLTVNLMVTASRDDTGKIFGYLFVAVDITKRKQAETNLLAAMVAAEASNRAKSAFLANMSHEIRTPMNGIIGMADLLLNSHLDGEQREFAGTIKSSSQALLTILNDILDYSKIEAGKLTIEWIDFDLHETLSSAIELFREAAQTNGLVLSYNIAPNVPRLVRCDPSRLRQIVMNLVGNAVKFTLKGSINVSVKWLTGGVHTGPDSLRVEVADTGIGIAPEILKNLFTPFTQADESTTRRFGGSGLGLAICQELVDRMGGTIGVDSTPGAGSLFWFTIVPESVGEFASHIAETHPVARAPAAKITAALGPRKQILIVEDHRVNQRVLQLLLEQLGYDTVVASNGREGVDWFQKRRFDAILMDCSMPELDGYQATGRIRQLENESGDPTRRVPVVAMTAHAMEGDRQRCLDAGMDDYLSKPVQIDALSTVLAQWTGPTRTVDESAGENENHPAGEHEHETPASPPNPTPAMPVTSPPQTTQPSASAVPPRVHVMSVSSSAQPAPPPPAVLNEARLRLVTGGRPAMLEQLVNMYISETQIRIDAMREAFKASDHAELARLGHTAYGSSAMLGVDAMAVVFKEVELKAKAQDLAATAPRIEALASMMPEAAERLRAFRLDAPANA